MVTVPSDAWSASGSAASGDGCARLMRHTAPTVAALKTFGMSNPLDCVILARRESIRDAEWTESTKTGASTAQFGSCGRSDRPGPLVGNPTNAPHAIPLTRSACWRRLAAPQSREQRGHIVADFGPVGLHLRQLGWRHEVIEPALEARPFARPRPPIPDMRPVVGPDAEQAQIVQPCSERHQVDVGQRRAGAEDPRPALGQRLLQLLERPLVGGDP